MMRKIVIVVLILAIVSISFAGCLGHKEPDIKESKWSSNPRLDVFRKEPLKPGTKVTIHVTLTNYGDAKGTGKVYLKIDGDTVDWDSATIYPQQSKTLTLSYKVRKGEHNIKIIGPNGLIFEKSSVPGF